VTRVAIAVLVDIPDEWLTAGPGLPHLAGTTVHVALNPLVHQDCPVVMSELHPDPDAVFGARSERCPYCDEAAMTDEAGRCMHCGAARRLT
jgi:hypothetical protein